MLEAQSEIFSEGVGEGALKDGREETAMSMVCVCVFRGFVVFVLCCGCSVCRSYGMVEKLCGAQDGERWMVVVI